MSTISLASTIVRSADQVSTDVSNDKVILGLTSEEYYSLKDVGARVWDLVQEQKTAAALLAVILRDYAVEPERGERDLLAFLQALANEGLIEIKSDAARR